MTRRLRVLAIALTLTHASCTTTPDENDGAQAATGGGVAAGNGGMMAATGGSGGSAGMSTITGGAGGMGTGGTGGSAGIGTGGTGGSAGMLSTGGMGGDAADASAGSGGSTMNPAASCADSSYIICEDFEAATIGGTPSGWTKHGDESAVADDAAHWGSKSLKLDAIPVWERRIYQDASGLGAAHWGRIYFKVQLPVPDAFVHSTLVAFSGTGPTTGPAEFRVVDTVKQSSTQPDVASRIQFIYNVQPQGAEFGTDTPYDREFDDQWHCAEWFIDGNTQSYRFYLDGEELSTIENGAGNYDGTDIPMSFDEIKIGWINYQESPPGFTAWLDDLAVDDERIGCD